MLDIKVQVQLLIQLNELDIQLDAFQKDLQQIPNRLREDELEWLRKKSKVDVIAEEIDRLEKQKSALEKEVQESQDHMTSFQSKLPMIKTNKEYQAALKEIDENKRMNKQREDQILEIIQKLESLKPEKKEQEELLHGSTVAFEGRKNELEAERTKVMDNMGTLAQQREQKAATVEARLLNAYQRIRKQKSDAVVLVLSGSCQGCHMKIAPQMRLDMQRATSLFTCPACHRILALHE